MYEEAQAQAQVLMILGAARVFTQGVYDFTRVRMLLLHSHSLVHSVNPGRRNGQVWHPFVTVPGWLMVWGWGLYLMLIISFFKEPRRPSVQLSAISTELSSEKKSGKLRRWQLLVAYS